MSTSGDHMRDILSALPDTFVLNTTTLNPVIPTGKHGIVFRRVSLAPVQNLAGRFRDTTWLIAVISPLTGPDAAGEALDEALDAVLDVLEAEPTLRWTLAELGAFDERRWCYFIEVTLYNEIVPDEEPAPDLDGMTVTELKTFATDHDIDLDGARLKADIRATIENALE
jgi:hypothetical protein